METEEQKKVAKEVYGKLKLIDPYSILAGGAPRDWYFGQKANDLDFYFFSTATTVRSVENQLTELLGVSVKAAEYNPEDHEHGQYKVMPFLRRVLEAEVEGQKVQFMQLTEPNAQFKVVDAMSVSICKIWATPTLELKLHHDFMLTLATKTMFLSEGYSWTDKHPAKISGRSLGDGFSLGTKRGAEKAIIRRALQEMK